MNSSVDNRFIMTEVAESSTNYSRFSGLAIGSVILSVLSPLALVHWIFCGFGVVAVALGLLAGRQIKANPDSWSGLWAAGCSVIFASVVVGYSIQSHVRHEMALTSGSQAAIDRFLEKIKQGKLEDAYWLTVPRHERRAFLKNKSDPQVHEQYLLNYADFLSRLSPTLQQDPSSFDIELKERGDMSFANRTYWVTNAYEVRAENTQLAIPVEATGRKRGGKFYWHISRYDINFK